MSGDTDKSDNSVSRSQVTRLSSTVIIIGLVSLLADISSEMIYPFIPIFLTQTLAAPATIVGLIEGIAVGTASIVTGLSGWVSDRVGRRKSVAFVGYALTAISRPLISLAGTWPIVLGARFADRLGKGIRTAPRDALVSESSAEHGRGHAFGFERALDSAGAVIGPLFGLFLFAWVGMNARMIFLVSCVPASIAALLILSVKERRNKVITGASNLRLSFAGTTRDYRRLLGVTAVFGLANSANAFLILRAQGMGLDTQLTILAYALYNAVAALCAIPAGKASDRFGRRDLLIAGYSIYAIVYFGFGVVNEAWLLWPLFAAYGLFPALTDGVAKAMAADTSGDAGRATAIGMYAMVVGVTQIIASYVGGLLWDNIDPRATFYFGTALSALAVVLLFALLPARSSANRT
jgi:MFS family permease